jgi:iron complex transport system substrate-binding protein
MKRLFVLALMLCGCGVAPAAPQAPGYPRRIVSLDYCADQFALKLADRRQIAALSPDATKPFSFMRREATGVPQVRSSAEDVIGLHPDLVVRAYGGGPNAVRFLEEAGVPVATLGYAEDFEGVRSDIRAMAALFGQRARGEALIAEMDARLEAAARAPSGVAALYMTPGGVTSGPGSLVHEMLRAAGLANYEAAPGWRPIPLEALALRPPDLLVAATFGRTSDRADLWSGARHPVAQRALKERPAILLDGSWTACGGWFIVDAVETLARGRDAIRPHADYAP